MVPISPFLGVSTNGVTLSGAPFKGVLFYLGFGRGTPILGNTLISKNIFVVLGWLLSKK